MSELPDFTLDEKHVYIPEIIINIIIKDTISTNQPTIPIKNDNFSKK